MVDAFHALLTLASLVDGLSDLFDFGLIERRALLRLHQPLGQAGSWASDYLAGADEICS